MPTPVCATPAGVRRAGPRSSGPAAHGCRRAGRRAGTRTVPPAGPPPARASRSPPGRRAAPAHRSQSHRLAHRGPDEEGDVRQGALARTLQRFGLRPARLTQRVREDLLLVVGKGVDACGQRPVQLLCERAFRRHRSPPVATLRMAVSFAPMAHEIDTSNVRVDGLNAYLAAPRESTGAGMLLLPMITGIGTRVREFADELAAAGVTTLSWDPFDGVSMDDTPRETMVELMNNLDDETCLAEMRTLLDHMFGELGLEQVGVVGYCLG